MSRSISTLAAAAFVCVVVHVSAVPAAAQSRHGNGHIADRAQVQAVRTATPIRIDGRLDEEAWAAAPVISEFVQYDPREGQPASQLTEVRVLFDDDALYIGARLHDDGPITTRLGRRDMPLLDADWFGIVIDSYHDHRTGFVFDVNPSGVQRDAIKTMTAGGERDDNTWDAVWQVATTIDDGGWTAEIRIPFSQLRFNPADELVWGILFERLIGRHREYSTTSYTPRSERGGIAMYGHLLGLEGLGAGKRLELLPYVVGRGEYVDRGGNPFRTDSEQSMSAGLDALYRLTSDLTLNATINPDFGQVEVDPAVINLGVYETFFQEKRPFFVEGSEIFNFGAGGGQLFYSRRIGRRPQLGAPAALSDVPDAANIIGAAKLSGRTASGWSIGIVEAVTGRADVRFLSDGVEERAIAEPAANYFVGRLRREMRGGQSLAGGILTMTHRSMSESRAEERLRSAAYAFGIDGRHEWANRRWVLYGNVALSRVEGSPGAMQIVQTAPNHYFQRPDASHLGVDGNATSLTGANALLAVGRQAGEHWRGELQVATTTPAYEINDLGFNNRTDRRDIQLQTTYLQQQPGRFWRNYNVTSRVRFEGNYANELIANWFTLTGNARHLNFWSVNGNATYRMRANDDRLTRGGPMAVRPAGASGFAAFASDPRRSVTVSGAAQAENDEFGGWGYEVATTVGLKPSPRWNLTLNPTFARGYSVAQYVATRADETYAPTFGHRYVFADLHQTTLSMETRFNWTFNPRLSFELYAQPFLSSGEYGEPKSLVAPKTFAFDRYDGELPALDFNVRSLRGTGLLRWEWRPGSTLYVAWQQSRSDHVIGTGDFSFSRDRQAMLRASPDNILVIKASYWFTP